MFKYFILILCICSFFLLGGRSKPHPNPIDGMIVVYWPSSLCLPGETRAPEYRVSLPHPDHPGIGWTDAIFGDHVMEEQECTADPLNLGIHYRECCVIGEQKTCTPVVVGVYPEPCSDIYTISGEKMSDAHVNDWNERHVE
ncbi:MAG: hypothetical protein ACXAD7_25480 [Candidatus Kariarchaeaceae archaeon]